MIARLIAYLRMRRIEIELDDRLARLAETQAPIERANLEHDIHLIRRQLTQARGAYQALFPPGQRMTWRQA
jgi:hypothetical protein